MNSAATVDNLVINWKRSGLTKSEIVVKAAEAMLGWPYVWGASGQDCTTDKRRYFMNRSAIGVKDRENIQKRCQILNGSKTSCDGCKYYPGGAKTRIQDCQGFLKELFKMVGITLTGAGATSMYNTKTLWTEQGELSNMPLNAVCAVFKRVWDSTKQKYVMDHVGLHIGGGNIIHCSGEVKRGKTSEKGWTHYAIPKGLEGGSSMPEATTRKTIRRGSTGIQVTELQEDLIKLNYDLGASGADGKFGAKTEAAVKDFQKKSGLTADGIVGPKTWEALEKAAWPDEGSGTTKTYIIQINHLTKEEADGLKAVYPDSIIISE